MQSVELMIKIRKEFGTEIPLAAMIQAMNERYRKHIITLEDPVEYTFESNRCLVEQRELGAEQGHRYQQRIQRKSGRCHEDGEHRGSRHAERQ